MSHTIYYIDRTVGEEISTRPLEGKEQLLFQELILAYQRGYCYLCGDIESLKQLSKQFKEYRLATEKYSEHGNAMALVDQVFVLTYDSKRSAPLPAVLQIGGKCCYIDISVAASNDWLLGRPCCLLGENLDDCDFFMLIAKFTNKNAARVQFDSQHGGGNPLAKVLNHSVEKQKLPTLAFVDSDKKYGATATYPTPATGDTALSAEKESMKLLSQSHLPPHSLCKLDVHEAENLIPVQILEELLSKLPNMKPGLERLKHLQTIQNGEPALYYDYKNGFPYIKSAPARAYWHSILTQLGGTEQDMPPKEKPQTKEHSCDELFFPPLSSNKLLERAICSMEGKTQLEPDPHLVPYWENISTAILTWGFASSPRYA